MEIRSYDLIDWVNEFLRQAEQEKIKIRTASSKLSKRFKMIENLLSREAQQQALNKLILPRDTIRFAEKNNLLYVTKLNSLKQQFGRYYFNPQKFVTENEIMDKASFMQFVIKSTRVENAAHFKAYNEHQKKLKSEPVNV